MTKVSKSSMQVFLYDIERPFEGLIFLDVVLRQLHSLQKCLVKMRVNAQGVAYERCPNFTANLGRNSFFQVCCELLVVQKLLWSIVLL